MVREVVLGYEDEPQPSGLSVFGSTIPGTEMMKDPELAKLLQANEVRICNIVDIHHHLSS